MKHVGEKSVVTLRNESESLYFTQQIWSKYQPTISKFYSQYGSSTVNKFRHEKDVAAQPLAVEILID